MRPLSGSRKCPDCGEVKPEDQFPAGYTYCKPCHNKRTRETVMRLYGGYRHYRLKQRYGIGAVEVDEMIAAQDGVCALCGERPATQVDHDHATGKVRGILCLRCNAALGAAHDDPQILRAAIRYLSCSANGTDVREVPALYLKRCPDCGREKPIEEFPWNRERRGTYCKPCASIRSKKSRERVHGSTRGYLVKLRYGVEIEVVEEFLRRQCGLCAICEEENPDHVDHDHVTKAVRGILCFNCNRMLGYAGDDPTWFEKAIAYLERYARNGDDVREAPAPYIIHVA